MARNPQVPDDEWARDSFSMRRMTPGEVWALTVAGIAVMVGLLVYAGL